MPKGSLKAGYSLDFWARFDADFIPKTLKNFPHTLTTVFYRKWGPSETKIDKYMQFFSFISSKQAAKPPLISIQDSSVLAVSLGRILAK
jgi:hypothetical protein